MLRPQGDRRKLLDNDNDSDGDSRKLLDSDKDGEVHACHHPPLRVEVIYIPAPCPRTPTMLTFTRTRLASTLSYWAAALDSAAFLTGLVSDVPRAQGDRRKLLDNDNDSDGEVRDRFRQCVSSDDRVVA